MFSLPSKRNNSLEWVLNSLYIHITSLPLPDMLMFDEEKTDANNPNISALTCSVSSMANFYDPFVMEVSLKRKSNGYNSEAEKEQRNSLVLFLLHLFDRPLTYLDISSTKNGNAALRKSTETYMHYLTHLHSNFCSLLDCVKKPQTMGFNNGRKQYEETLYDSNKSRPKISNMSLGTFYYMLLGEKVESSHVPCVYSHIYILHQCLPLCVCLLRRNEDCAIYKGLMLGKAVTVDIGVATIDAEVLDSNDHIEFLSALVNIMVFCCVNDFRFIASHIVPDYIRKFKIQGRYVILLNLLKRNKHSGVLSFLIGMVKENLNVSLDSTSSCPYFSGSKLKLLFDIIFTLPNGEDTDLLDSNDHIITALNILRFALLRDQGNKTGIKDYMMNINKEFVIPLRTALNVSKRHYQLTLEEMKKGNDSAFLGGSTVDLEVTLGQNISQLNRDQQLDIVITGLNMLDLIECVLVRVEELIPDSTN